MTRDEYLDFRALFIKSINNSLRKENLFYYLEAKSDIDGKSYMDVQFAHDEINGILYIYYIFDPTTRWTRVDNIKELYTITDNAIYSMIKGWQRSYKFRPEIIGPSNRADNIHKCNTYENTKLSHNTVSIWTSHNGTPKFIDNQSILLINRYKNYINNASDIITSLDNAVVEINQKYNNFINPDDRIDGFNEYKLAYKNIVGQDLDSLIEKEKVFTLLNYNDYHLIPVLL